MGTRSIAPMCILVKDHSRVLCEQLQQLRLQTGLVDLDIVCEDHHINVHKVVMAACSKFFKDQLCKQNVQVPVILRLEDFGLELKRDAVSYIIEFVYRGEVNIPGERLTEVCQAAHTLGVVGLEHLPVPAGPQRPPLLTKEHLQIADESELREDVNMYNPFNNAVNSSPQTSMGKFAMDINNINMNPFFNMNNNAMQNDDIILLQTTEDQSRSIHNTDPDIIPISFGETTVSNAHEMSNQRLYHNQIQNDKINLIVSEEGQVSEQYRIIPEMLSDGTFHEETIDSCLSLFPNHNSSEPQDLSPVKTQETMPKVNANNTQRQGKNISNSQQHQPNELSMNITGNQTTFQALFEAASNELVVHNEMSKSGSSNIVFSTPSTSVNTICSTPTRPPSVVSQKPLPQIKPADCAIVDSKRATKDPNKNTSPGKSLSQGKLRVINQGIQSENIQSPTLAEYRNKARRRSGQVIPSQLAHPHLPGQVAHIPAQLPHIPGQVALSSGQVAPVGPIPVTIPPSLNNIPVPSVSAPVPVRNNGVRLMSVGPNEATPHSPTHERDSESESEVESDPPPVNTGLATPGLVPWNSEEIWPNKSWTHPVESVDTSVPTSGAVWQLPATQAKSNTTQWNINTVTQLETSLSRNLGLQEPDLSIIPPSIATRGHPTIPWNTPVTNDNSRDGKWENIPVTTASNPTAGSRDTPPNVSVSWTQPQTSACPSPVLPPGNILTGLPIPQVGPEVELTSSSTSPSLEEAESTETVVDQLAQIPGPSWRNTFGSDDNMLAIRSGIPLALQNKAIRSGVPIGPFQNKRKRKSRSSQDGAKAKKRMSVGGKKGDLEVRKDLTIESQKNNEDLAMQNVFQNDESSPSTSNIVSKTKEETSISLEKNEIMSSVSSPIGGVHIKTVKMLNSDAVADLEFDPSSDLSSSDLGESSKADKYQFSCVNCSMMFSSAGQLKRHTQNAHGKEETLFCQVCPERCHGKENLKLHLYKTHGIGEMFRCEECNYESPVKAVYIKHLSEHIPQEAKKKKCPKCDKVFKTKTGLNMHLKQHFDESLFSCLRCDFKTPQKLNLVKHTASKHGQDVEGRLLDMSFTCELCDFKCIAEHMLKNHTLRKHTQKSAMRFHCTNCNYATVEKAALDKHMRFKHTNERPFMCDTCGFSTHTASAMARHKRSHSNTKPHKCELCGHEYADKKRLRDHMYIHSDHKPFKCELCNYTCRRKDNLTAHLKKQHDTVSKQEKYELVAIPDSTSNSGEWTHTDLLSVTNSSQCLSLPPPDLEPPKPVWEADLGKSGYSSEKSRPQSSMSTYSDKPRPQSSMSGYSDKPRATSSPISSCGGMSGPTPPSLPTIAMADIAVPYSHPTTDYSTTETMSHYITTQADLSNTHYTQDISWTVDNCHTDHEEVIFVPQDSQHNNSNWGPFINYVNLQYDHGSC